MCNNTCAAAFDGICQDEGNQCYGGPSDGVQCTSVDQCLPPINDPSCAPTIPGYCMSGAFECFEDFECDAYAFCPTTGPFAFFCGGEQDGLTCETDSDCPAVGEGILGTCINSFINGATCTQDSDCPPEVVVCESVGGCELGSDCADCESIGIPRFVSRHVFSDPTKADTDFDGLPDFVEHAIRTDPNNVDTDQDGLLDFDEFSNFSLFFQNNFLFEGFFISDAGSQKLGTSPLSQDTDGDRLSDSFEQGTGWRVLSVVDAELRDVTSSPLAIDTDGDGLNDLEEFLGRDAWIPGSIFDTGDATDPTDLDTDGDGIIDGAELESDPLTPDLVAEVVVTAIEIGLHNGSGENWSFEIFAGLASSTEPGLVLNSGQVRDVFGLEGSPTACGGVAGGDIDITFGDNSVLGNSIISGPPLNQRMLVGDTLVIRWRVTNACGATCESHGVIPVSYGDIATSSWLPFTIDAEQHPTQDEACMNAKFGIEVRRR